MAKLRDLVLRGGLYMAGRQMGGMLLSLATLLGVARLIGPADYGIYASAFGLYSFLLPLAQWGLNVYLIRKPDPLEPEDLRQAQALLLAIGAAVAGLAWPLALAAGAWTGIGGLAPVMAAVFLLMPLQLAATVPAAVLERRLDYRRVAMAELGGQLCLCGLSVALALGGAGRWAPVAGLAAQQVAGGLLLWRASGLRPGLAWDRRRAADMLGHGLGLAASQASWQLRLLVNPLVVARLLGAEAAGTVAVAIRLVEGLAFMRTVVWRVTFAGMGRLRDQPRRLAVAVAEGMRIQVLVIGPAMAAFSWLAPWLVPFAFGRGWTPVAALFPYIACGALINGVFSLHSSALYVLRRADRVTRFHLVHLALFAGSAALLVWRLGLPGYGYAELAALASYGLIHRSLVRLLGPVEAALGLWWAGAFAGPLFAPCFGPWAWLAVGALLLPRSLQALSRYWLLLKESAHV